MHNHPLIVGVDGTAASAAALTEAVRLAEAQTGQGGLDVIVVYVRQSSWASMSVDAGAGLSQALNEVEADVRRIAGDALDGTALSWRIDVREGDPGRELVKVARAEGAQTIVVGGHRHGAIGATLTRAVNAELVHGFEGSLLIVRPALDGDDIGANTRRSAGHEAAPAAH